MEKWIQLLVTGITVGSIYSLIALGYVTIYRTSRIVNMAQGAFVMFGAFFTYSFLSEVGLPYWLSADPWHRLRGDPRHGMYLLVLRPLIKISLVSIILATMALSILFENFALLRWGGYGKSVPAFTGDKALFIGKVAVFPPEPVGDRPHGRGARRPVPPDQPHPDRQADDGHRQRSRARPVSPA